MSEEKSKPNVVDIERRKARQQHGGELLNAVRDTAVKRSRELVAKLFENVDDALFDLAEKAESNTAQTRYFDGMREVRRKRQLIERLYTDNVQDSFKRFANGKLIVSSARSRDKTVDENELSLVEETELEESLAIASMISKAENHHARTLYAVNQRLSVISGGSKVDVTNNPLGPACLCDCFRGAMKELDADINVKLIIYKLFERYVIAGLDSLYEKVNAQLVRAGVLPQLRRRVDRRGARAPVPSGEHGHPAGREDYPDSAEDEALREQLYGTVNQLLSRRRQAMHPAGHTAADGPVLDVRELLGALALLQQQAPPVPQELSSLDAQRDASLSLEELKTSLHQQISKISENAKARVSGADEDTIDLVGMLFEYILEDRNLPTQMQALLGRLQIPYLKIAILDRHMFAKQSHPARRLLDRLAAAAKSWSKESDRDLRLFNEIKTTVETLLHDFDDDVELFEQLLHRFESFTARIDTRAERTEKRTADAIQGKEKLQSARRVAARAVLERTRDVELPDLIRNILTRPWANYLVLTALRQGEDSKEWHSAVRFMDDLVASTTPPTTEEGRQQVREMLPHIEKTLRHGLSAVAFSDGDVRRLIRALGRYYLGLISDPGTAGSAEMDDPLANEPVIPESVEEVSEPPPEVTPTEPVSVPADDSESMRTAKSLKLGSWVEFVAANGQRDRAKLSWISPISGKYLFVNRRGLKVCDMTLDALAANIHDGSTVVLEEVPLFDRALDAIVERLKKDQSGDGNPQAATKPAAVDPDPAATVEASSSDSTPTSNPPD